MKLHSLQIWLLVGLLYVVTIFASFQLQQTRFNQVAELLANNQNLLAEFQLRTEPKRYLARFASDQEQIQYSFSVKLTKIKIQDRWQKLSAPATAVIETEELSFYRGQKLRAEIRFIDSVSESRSCCLLSIQSPPELMAPANKAFEFAHKFRRSLQAAMPDQFLNGSALVPGLVLGDTSKQSLALESAMRGSGLAHLTAVSGGNVSIVLGFVLAIFIGLGATNRILILIAAITLAGYVLAVGFDASVLRAATMGSITLLAVLTSSAITTGWILLGAVYLLTAFNPWLWQSWGFLLSTAATAGLIWLAPKFLTSLSLRPPVNVIAALVAATVAATWVTAPLLAVMTQEIPVVSVLANLVAAPLVAITTILGLIAAIVAFINPQLAMPLCFLVSMPAELIGKIALTAAAMPGAQLQLDNRSELVAFLLLVPVLVLVVLISKRRKVIFPGLVLLLICYPFLLSATRYFDGWPPVGTFLIACDVGQGTAILLPVQNRSAVLIDTGPDPQLINRCLASAQISSLPLILISHFHADHAAGLAGAIRNREVGQILVSPNLNPSHQFAQVADLANKNQIELKVVSAGTKFKVKPYSVEVLWPKLDSIPINENDSSLILLIKDQTHSFLFTGDLEPAGQAALMRTNQVLVSAALVPHHGSKYQDPNFPSWTKAELALISVGENSFGHPADQTLASWQQQAAVVSTAELGDIALVSKNGDLTVVTR